MLTKKRFEKIMIDSNDPWKDFNLTQVFISTLAQPTFAARFWLKPIFIIDLEFLHAL